MNYQAGSFFVDILTLIILLISVFLLRAQIVKTHEWNRRKAAEAIITQCTEGEIIKIRRELVKYVKFYDFSHSYQSVLKEIKEEERKELDYLLKIFLSFHEKIALGIKHNIYSEDILYDYLRSSLPELYRWSKKYIEDFRKKDTAIFIELVNLAEKWKQKNENIKHKCEESNLLKGKDPL